MIQICLGRECLDILMARRHLLPEGLRGHVKFVFPEISWEEYPELGQGLRFQSFCWDGDRWTVGAVEYCPLAPGMSEVFSLLRGELLLG